MRVEASGLDYVWQETYQALIEAAHAEPALRALYPFTSHCALRFSTTTRPRLTVPDRGQRRQVRGGDRVHHFGPWPVRHSARGRGGGRAPYAGAGRPPRSMAAAGSRFRTAQGWVGGGGPGGGAPPPPNGPPTTNDRVSGGGVVVGACSPQGGVFFGGGP
ncbi:DUF6193 family natural product biosynthesis protein, partial [Streptomyces griseorubiginosus]|uniref:DUF6193 family natural product biosynthesis protein n=1 Tax=Streptomyces griseorubiginosus TaxID=67304 RepID=UPI0036E75C16